MYVGVHMIDTCECNTTNENCYFCFKHLYAKKELYIFTLCLSLVWDKFKPQPFLRLIRV